MRSFLYVLLLLLLPASATSSAAELPSSLGLFRDYVKDGRVQYSALKNDARLKSYAKTLSEFPISKAGLSTAGRMAFWINVYNTFTLTLICDNWPVKSILDLDNGKVWDRKWVEIDGTTYSLNQIENDLVRPMGDPRIHFALVCAAKSCPPLRSEEYTADKLNDQLNDQGISFLGNKDLNRFSASDQRARLSKIFEWYGTDFGTKSADLIRALAPYAPSAARSSMRSAPAGWKVEFLTYDWALNGH